MCIKILDMQFKLQPAHPIPSYIFCEVRPSKNENIKQVLKWGLFTGYKILRTKLVKKLKLLTNTIGMGISISKAFCYMHGIVEVGNIVHT